MKILRNGEVKIYSSSKEMPIGRYADFQKYLVQDIGIESLFTILNKATAFSQEGMNKECEIEIENVGKAILSLKDGIPTTSYTFAVLVAEIGLKQPRLCTDTTIDGLNETIRQLSELNITQQEIEDAIEDVKKKMKEEIARLFPDLLSKTSDTFYYSKLKRYVLLCCQMYGDIDNPPSEEDKKELLNLKNWFIIKEGISQDGLDIERHFLSLLPFLELTFNNTVLEFYSKLDYINKKTEKEIAQTEAAHNGR